MAVAAIILAAGRSTRMGSNKLLEDLHGKPLVRHVAEAAVASKVQHVIAVTGHQSDEVEAALDGLDVRFIHNPDYAKGLSTSLKAGVADLSPGITAAIILLGDMPFVTADVINSLIAAFDASPDKIAAVPLNNAEWGNPVLLSRTLFGEIATLRGDAGARKLLQGKAGDVIEVPVTHNAVLIDIDTPEALAKARMKGD